MLVSITVPTCNRESRLPMLHAQFERQTWSGGELELVVLDDSPEPSPYFQTVSSKRVRYLHDPVRASIGKKRARLLELARGELQIQFDDDDFYAPDYVAATLAHLGDNDFFHYDTWHLYRECDRSVWYWDTREVLGIHYDVTGLVSEVPKTIRTWALKPDFDTNKSAADWRHQNQWGWGFCYAYRSEIARKASFPNVQHGEDYEFVKRLVALGAKMHLAPDDDGLCVHVLRSEGSGRCFPQYRLPTHHARRLLALPPGALEPETCASDMEYPAVSNASIPLEHVIVISLNPTEDKRQHWQSELAKVGLAHLDLEVLTAINGRDCTPEWLAARGFALYPEWRIPDSDNGWWNRELTPGEIGCSLSHIAAWNLAKGRGWKNVLFLEEDFRALGVPLRPEQLERLPSDWDMLYLGRNPLRPDRRAIDAHLVRPGASYTSHAYVLSASGIDKFLAQDLQRRIVPLDEFLIATYVRHPRGDLSVFATNSQAYAVRPNVIGQTSVAATSTTERAPVPPRVVEPVRRVLPRPAVTVRSYFEDKQAWVQRYLAPGVKDKQWDLLADEPIAHLYCVPFFNQRFCEEVRGLAEASGAWTTKRHANYPTTDMLLTALGLEAIYADLLNEYVIPLCIHKYGLQGRGWDDMTSESFVARYTPETQGYLAIDHDAADISALVNLSEPDLDYQGGGTWFWHQKTLYRPPQGSLSVHPGNITHKHGARPVTEGSRYVLVTFMNQSTRPRNQGGSRNIERPGAGDVQKAVDLATTSPDARNWLNASLEYYRAGDYAGCIRAAQEALRLRPGYGLAYNNLCAAYNKLGRWDEALQAGLTAVQLRPDDRIARNNLADAQRAVLRGRG